MTREEFWKLFLDERFISEAEETLAGTKWCGVIPNFESIYLGLFCLANSQKEALAAILAKMTHLSDSVNITIFDNGTFRNAQTTEEIKTFFAKAAKANDLYDRMNEIANLYNEFLRLQKEIETFQNAVQEQLPGSKINFGFNVEKQSERSKQI